MHPPLSGFLAQVLTYDLDPGLRRDERVGELHC